jgi:tRNA threonylcarbamoyl adenosine modification protein YeaZ
MKCLLWETSSVPWGVGVAEFASGKSTLLAHVEDSGARSLARQVIHAADAVLETAKCRITEMDAMAVSLGPGSWTGLRIGLTAAKTMAQTLNLPIIGIATFDIFAQSLQQPEDDGKMLLVQAPCRPGELYAKLWRCRGTERDLLEAEWIGSHQQIAGCLEGGTIVGGPEQKTEELLQREIIAPLEFRKSTFAARLQALGQLAAARADGGQWDDALILQPIYLAPSAAEREYHAKHHNK